MDLINLHQEIKILLIFLISNVYYCPTLNVRSTKKMCFGYVYAIYHAVGFETNEKKFFFWFLESKCLTKRN